MSGFPLRFVDETEALPLLSLQALAASGPGRAELLAGVPAPEPPAGALQRIGGPVRPPWYEGRGWSQLSVCRTGPVWHLPGRGLLVADDGLAYAAPAAEARFSRPGLGAAPGVMAEGDGWRFTPPSDAPRVEAATVWLPFGADFNYGHFLLDALPSLLAVEAGGLLDGRPPLSPPLKRWQRALLDLAFDGAPPPLVETRAPVVRLQQAAYATSLDHFLNAPNLILNTLRDRIRAAAARSPARGGETPRRIYLSRRSHRHSMRPMLNERALETALRARGFAIVRPETLPVARQVALMMQAEVVVAPTGAALANAALTRPGTLVFEIQPEVFTSGWVHAFSTVLGQKWQGWFAPAPVPPADVPLLRRARRGFRFAYRLPVDDFLAFLDARL